MHDAVLRDGSNSGGDGIVKEFKVEEAVESEEYGVCSFVDRLPYSPDMLVNNTRSSLSDLKHHGYQSNDYAHLPTGSAEPLSLVVQRPFDGDKLTRRGERIPIETRSLC